VKKTKTKKLGIKKVTLQNLDEPTLDAMAGGCCPTVTCDTLCGQHTCVTCYNYTCVKC
jgi:hypothetical protein